MSTVLDVVKAAREKREPESIAKHTGQPIPEKKPEEKAKLGDLTFKAVKVDDQGVITLCASSIAKDGDNDTVQKGAMIGMAFDFCGSKDRIFHANHDKGAKIDAQLVESCIGVPVLKSGKVLEPGQEIPSDDPFDHVRTMDAAKACNTHWFVSVRPTDARIVEAAKKGEIVGASWGGMALKADD